MTSLLSRTVVRIDLALAELLPEAGETIHSISNLPAELVKALVENLFLVPESFDEIAFARVQHNTARENKQVMNVVIAPTLGCNMGCYYCFEKRSDAQLDDRAITSLTHLISEHLPDFESLHVQWFGGEPLLALDTLKKITRRLREVCASLGKTYSAEIITNGHHLTEGATEDLLRLGVSAAQVTFEGARKLHERIRRPLNRQSGAYDTLVQNVNHSASKLDITARIHVAPYSLDSAYQLLEDLSNRGLGKRLKLLYFAPLFSYRSGHRKFTSDQHRYLSSKDYAETEIGLLQEAKRLGFVIPDPLNATYDICVAMQQGAMVVGPKGHLFKCYLDIDENEEAIGNVSQGIDQKRLYQWSDYDFSKDQICRSCTFLPVCLGGCPKQEMTDADKSVICTPLKFNFHDRMLLNYQ